MPLTLSWRKSLSYRNKSINLLCNDIDLRHERVNLVANKEFTVLTHFTILLHFCTPWKRKKTIGFLTISEGVKMEHWREISWTKCIDSRTKCKQIPICNENQNTKMIPRISLELKIKPPDQRQWCLLVSWGWSCYMIQINWGTVDIVPLYLGVRRTPPPKIFRSRQIPREFPCRVFPPGKLLRILSSNCF